jgi:hypothetical protein
MHSYLAQPSAKMEQFMRESQIGIRTVIGIFMSVLLSSCAAPLGNGPVDWDHGARRGHVQELLDANAASAAVQACVPAAADKMAGRYAKVRYRGSRLHHTVVAVIPDGLDIYVGDEVELWPAGCDEGRMAHVGRVLPPPVGHQDAS